MAASRGATGKGSRPKHIPTRMCVACRQPRAKRELVRIVRTPQGQIEIDRTGKKSGRGAYLCQAKPCWDLAFRRKALEHALQTPISAENRSEIEKFVETLPEEL